MQHNDDAATPGRDRATTQARQYPRQGHDNPTTQAATSRDVSHPDVLTVAQAAQLLGVSARTVQRQCRAGKLRSTRLETEFGEQWEIERAEVERAATEPRRTPRQGRDIPATTPRQRHDTPHDRAATQGTTDWRQSRDDEPEQRHDATPENARANAKSDQQAAPDFAARYVTQIEAENAFLRATVEQHQRSEAELRAALREALKAQPRQLEGPTEGAGVSSTEVPLNRVDESKHASDATTATDRHEQTQKSAAQKESRPLWKLLLGIR